jgi:hypothetical protein
VLLVLAGVWVLCQVLAGNALTRLGLDAAAAAAAETPQTPGVVPKVPKGLPL